MAPMITKVRSSHQIDCCFQDSSRRKLIFSDMASYRKTLVSFVIVHIYMVICALIFHVIEYDEGDTLEPNFLALQRKFTKQHNMTNKEFRLLFKEAAAAIVADRKVFVRAKWKSFVQCLWFIITVFTTVGTGYIVPQTFTGRLLTIILSLIGIPLYALFLKYAGDVIVAGITLCLQRMHKKLFGSYEVKHLSLKVLFLAFLLMIATILLGAIPSKQFDMTYFEGVYFLYISFSTIGFGDLVPKASTRSRRLISIVYLVYIFVGYAFVSCFISSLVKFFHDMAVYWRQEHLSRIKLCTRKNRKINNESTRRENRNTDVILCIEPLKHESSKEGFIMEKKNIALEGTFVRSCPCLTNSNKLFVGDESKHMPYPAFQDWSA